MDVSVVIPVRNRPGEVACAVGAALASARAAIVAQPALTYEIIVVDNASTDATAEAARQAGARVVSEPAIGHANARNRGAREAAGRWIAFLDSDCEPEAGWLGALARKLAEAESSPETRVGAVGGRVRDVTPPDNPTAAYLAARGWFDQEKYLARDGSDPLAPRFALTANLAVRRDVFLDLGGLDPALAHAAEDAEFCLRLADAGWALAYAPGAAVAHHHRATPMGLWRQAVGWGSGQAELFDKWGARAGRRAWIEPRHYVWAAKGLLKTPWRLATGRTPLERWEPWLDFVANAGLALGRATMGLRKGKLVL